MDHLDRHGADRTADHPAPDVNPRRLAEAAAGGVVEMEPLQSAFIERREGDVGKLDQRHELTVAGQGSTAAVSARQDAASDGVAADAAPSYRR